MQDTPITHRGTVYPWQCDHMGHMNVLFYVGKFDEATWNLFVHMGMPPSYFRDSGRGMVAVAQHTTYKRELLAGDVVFVRSWVVEVREKVVRITHEMVNGESQEVVAVTELTGVHLDRATRKSCAMPADVIERARTMVRPAGAG